MGKYQQGIFKPKNPQKYKGNSSNIVYRSSWELKCMIRFDNDPNVLSWSSEETIIWYRSPIDGRKHRYFMDFHVTVKDRDGNIREALIEVKPEAQTRPPAAKAGKPTKRYLTEVATWGVNDAKWKAARLYCAERGWEFHIFTEKDLGIKR